MNAYLKFQKENYLYFYSITPYPDSGFDNYGLIKLIVSPKLLF